MNCIALKYANKFINNMLEITSVVTRKVGAQKVLIVTETAVDEAR